VGLGVPTCWTIDDYPGAPLFPRHRAGGRHGNPATHWRWVARSSLGRCFGGAKAHALRTKAPYFNGLNFTPGENSQECFGR